jgi:hypothetical protein
VVRVVDHGPRCGTAGRTRSRAAPAASAHTSRRSGARPGQA